MRTPRSLVIAVCLLVAACGGGGLGYETAPASLDPMSPKVLANNIAFDTDTLDVPTNAAFVLVFENQENVGHNVSIYADAAFGTRLFEGTVFSGPATRWYPVPALAPGTYHFRCDLHPNMAGELRAG
jgi:plastocyanin